jgi:predicted ATPase/DNA-binding winged helix-turn-helix (wHTH) protein
VSQALRFGRVEVRPRERQVLIDGTPAGVGARAFDLLLALIERRDRLVTKAELLDAVWPGLVVEENNLQVQISTLRKLLGPQSIATVPGRGYRFTGSADGAPAPAAGPAATAPVGESPEPRRTNLPSELPVLYGRAEELAALAELLAAHRLVTVVGAGGIGKSRLAQAAAASALARFADGAWIAELAGLSEPALLANTVASALDLKIAGKGDSAAELVGALAGKSLLLVLDNCEHLLDAVGRLVEAIRRDAPGVALLATSQEPLRLPDEQQFRLVPLAVPASAEAVAARDFGAVALFEARVRAVDPRFALNPETAPLAIDICRRLDGLPLAIELAAARVATLGLRAVRDKLDARFKLLTGGARATLRRHQTLRAALEWSHALLNDAERIVFRRLGVFAGSFTMELAQAIAADDELDDWAVLEHLSALVEKSLVIADAGDSPRYRLLESTRAFALEQLAAGDSGDMLRRHAEAMLAFLRQVDELNLEGELRTDQYAALLVPELDDLRAAYAWASGADGDRALAIALAAHAGSLIDYAVECADWLLPHLPEVVAGAVGAADAARYWRALAAGNMALRQPLVQCADAAERALSLYRTLGKPRRMFGSLMRLAHYRQLQGDAAATQAALAEARTLIRPDWPTEFHIHMLRREAALARAQGRNADAVAAMRAEVRLSETAGDWRLQAIARNNLIDILWQVDSIEQAESEARRLTEDLERRPAGLSDTDNAYANLVGICSEMERFDEALCAARRLLPLLRVQHGRFLEEWIYLFARLGQPAAAALLLGALDAETAATGTPSQPNETRLVAKARAQLQVELAADELARYRASGALLDRDRVYEVLADTLARIEGARA